MIIVILGFIVVLVIGGIILWKFCLSTERGHAQDNQQILIEMKSLKKTSKTSNTNNIYTKKAQPDLQSQSYTTSYQMKNETAINIEESHDQYANKNNQEQDKLKNIEPKTSQMTNKYQKEEEQFSYQKTQYITSQKREEYQFQQQTYQLPQQVSSQCKEEQKQQQFSYQQTQYSPKYFTEEKKEQQRSYQQAQQIPKYFKEEQKQQEQSYQRIYQVTSQYQEKQNQYQSFETVKQQPIQNTIAQNIKRTIPNIIPQYREITEQVIIQTLKPIIFLIGQGGIGKTQIFNDISKYKTLEIKKISQKNFYLIEFDNYFLIDTPKFELNDDIDIREQTIEQFSPIFNDLRSQISAFVIVCKFERTDIMKKNIMDSYKFLQNQKHYINLLINDFHLSENKEADMNELNIRFRMFISNPEHSQEQERIMYYDKLIKNQDEKFYKIMEQFELLAQGRISQRFSDTIFENNQSEKYQLEMQNLQSQISQNFQNLQNPRKIQIY